MTVLSSQDKGKNIVLVLSGEKDNILDGQKTVWEELQLLYTFCPCGGCELLCLQRQRQRPPV